MAEAPSLTIHLFSFGFKYSGPPEDQSGNGGGFVFDCRSLPNPYWDEALRPHSGLEAPIREFMEGHPEVSVFAEGAAGMVLNAVRVYKEREYTSMIVAFGCTGGRHRSVYQAERLRTTLEAAGYRVKTNHLDVDRRPEDAGSEKPRL